ncbi:MAG: hypothetical protein M3220_09580 [Chloroflexota bacterium]|nr:hypothetical protein [Chloroflexota bacterium]
MHHKRKCIESLGKRVGAALWEAGWAAGMETEVEVGATPTSNSDANQREAGGTSHD